MRLVGELMEAAMTAELRELARDAFVAGFGASGEGWNGEYPFGDKAQDIAEDPDLQLVFEKWANKHFAASSSAARPAEPTEYEVDDGGRFYARYANGEVLPTGETIRAFAGKSHITPERYKEIRHALPYERIEMAAARPASSEPEQGGSASDGSHDAEADSSSAQACTDARPGSLGAAAAPAAETDAALIRDLRNHSYDRSNLYRRLTRRAVDEIDRLMAAHAAAREERDEAFSMAARQRESTRAAEARAEELTKALQRITDELGVPDDNYLAPVASAVAIARAALAALPGATE